MWRHSIWLNSVSLVLMKQRDHSIEMVDMNEKKTKYNLGTNRLLYDQIIGI